MKRISLVLSTLLAFSGVAWAQEYQLETIQVRPAPLYTDDEAALSFDCRNLHEPTTQDVERALQINDQRQTNKLRRELMEAIGEACDAGSMDIVVERGKDGRSVNWFPVATYHPPVVEEITGVDLY
jgi:hypothetical protein